MCARVFYIYIYTYIYVHIVKIFSQRLYRMLNPNRSKDLYGELFIPLFRVSDSQRFLGKACHVWTQR